MRKWVDIGKVLVLFLLFVYLLQVGGRARSADFRGICQLARVRIDGSTNVNQFHFYYDQPQEEDFSLSSLSSNSSADPSSLVFYVPVDKIDASNPAMLSDFKELLKASKYPKIRITLQKDELAGLFGARRVDSIPLAITIAGVTNDYDSPVEVVNNEENRVVVKGRTRIRLTDYHITPPHRFLGMIRVKDEVFINFEIKLITQKANSP
jgi:polyisoprenoid-binding protein YceI